MPDPAALFTYGSPRVGARAYLVSPPAKAITHHRWVNCIDMVPTLPSPWMGFAHHGQLHYLNHFGNVRKLTPWQGFKDKVRGLRAGLASTRLGLLDSHSISLYREFLGTWAAGKENPQDKP